MTDDITRSWWLAWLAPDTGSARATRARLRRADGWRDAMLEPAAIVLAKRLGTLDNEARLEMALGLATVLAHVKQDAPGQRLMRQLGYDTPPLDRGKGDTPRLAPVRFTRLLRSTPDELPLALIRLIRLAGGTANVSELGKAMMLWTHEATRERQRRTWAFDYYAASAAAPEANPQTDTDPDTTKPERTAA